MEGLPGSRVRSEDVRHKHIPFLYKHGVERDKKVQSMKLTSSLLGLDKSCCTVNAYNEATGDFGIESSAVAGLLDA